MPVTALGTAGAGSRAERQHSEVQFWISGAVEIYGLIRILSGCSCRVGLSAIFLFRGLVVHCTVYIMCWPFV
jgi:hypothetical protein